MMGRSMRMDTPRRCDFDNLPIPKGKYGLEVTGDPERVKAQGFYHGRNCYQAALTNYEKKQSEFNQ